MLHCDHHSLLFLRSATIFLSVTYKLPSTMTGEERIINRNPYLFGPGPVRRVPKGFLTSYGRMPPVQGFTMAAVHGMIIALGGALIFKYGFGDPQIKAIEDYYKENPPR
jgi:hypothetical protein